ncbi:MAG: antitoxin YezG family protein [Clostridia bacterium]|nr:antitoxin YezG family protein [Clostridia bacterium]
MLNNTKRIKELYEEIQRKIFYAVPGKWDELYLYASIIERLGKIQTGEMYFYFLPKALLKRKFINVYEVPSKYDIEEEEYLNLINLLYDNIKELREEFIKSNQPVWSNITITIKNNRFKIEYNYDKLSGTQNSYYSHHIYWRYKYLNIEPHSKREKEAIEEYLAERKPSNKHDEEYDTGVYLKRKTNIITYDTTDFKENQRVEYLAKNQGVKKTINQILSK